MRRKTGIDFPVYKEKYITIFEFMSLVCYHASHEQFAPSELLKYAMLAEKAGFGGIHSSDHFHPWSERQGQSGFSFSWIAAAMQATRLPFSLVCAPGQRYHPAIVAQAGATLAEMFPGRFNLELGTGEALNEVITRTGWPDKKVRNERLLECAGIIRRLWAGEEVTYSGHVKIQQAKLYTLPVQKPLLLCAAISTETACWAGSWADGLLTTAEHKAEDNQPKIDAFRKNGGEDKPVYLQFGFSYARNRKDAEEGVFDQWRSNILPRKTLANLRTVSDFDEAGKDVTIREVTESVPIYTDMQKLKNKIQEFKDLGVSRVILHNINRMQEEFINDYSR